MIISACVSACFFTLQLLLTKAETFFELQTRSKFPHEMDKEFVLTFAPRIPDERLDNSVYYMMLIVIRDKFDEVKEKTNMDYGFKEMSETEFKGDYFRMPKWRLINNVDLNVTIFFNKKANGMILEFYDCNAKSRDDRAKMLQSLPNNQLVLRETIMLHIPPTVELSIQSNDGRKGEVVLNQLGIATCVASGGSPQVEPQFTNPDILNVVSTTPNSLKNEIVLRFKVSVMDHLKVLKCEAGNVKKEVEVKVLHHPTQVSLEPEIVDTVENGTKITCSAADGHPPPTVSWHFVYGPVNATRFFEISPDGKELFLKKEAPIGTHWQLNCSATNVLPTSTVTYNRTVAFVVGRPSEGLFQLNLTTQVMIGVAVVGAIILFCVVIVLIVCVSRKGCDGPSTASSSRKNGVTAKTAAEKKNLEAEQVTLLPPGAPQNHLDSVNVVSGLPPPPPECQLILDTEKQPIPVDQHIIQMDNHNQEVYPEVTYAELNTSDLPMKGSKPIMNNNNNNNNINNNNINNNNNNISTDDQVIYSQIIGTMSSNYSSGGPYIDPNNV